MAERQPKRDIRTKALACMYIARAIVHALKNIVDREGVESNRGMAGSSLVPRPFFCGGEEKRQGPG